MGDFWPALPPSRPGTEKAGLLQEGGEAPQYLALGAPRSPILRLYLGRVRESLGNHCLCLLEDGQLPGWGFMQLSPVTWKVSCNQ